MTTREWQHNMYARDRWQVNNKLTLDLGLRYEYYPLMTRADRGIEKVARHLEHAGARYACDASGAAARRRQLPKDLGIKVSKTLFAPRLGAVYRLNDNTVFRTGYGITYNPLPFSRPLRGFFPLTLARNSTRPNPYGWATTLEQGIPDVVGPGPELGRLPLPN